MLDLTPTPQLEAHPRLAGLGLEPLDRDFDGPALAAALAGRQSALKLALMDQRVVVGVGNIYACESLFRARLSPRRIAGHLRPREAGRLAARDPRRARARRSRPAARRCATTSRPTGELGFFQDRFAVYGRSGQPCRVCGQAIRRIAQANRATFYCAALSALSGARARARFRTGRALGRFVL